MTELTQTNIDELRQSITANIDSLEQTLNKERSKQNEQPDVNEELLGEIELACEQSKMLLKRIDEIESTYHSCMKEKRRLTNEEEQLMDQFGFIIPSALQFLQQNERESNEDNESQDHGEETAYDDDELKMIQDLKRQEQEQQRMQQKILDEADVQDDKDSNDINELMDSILSGEEETTSGDEKDSYEDRIYNESKIRLDSLKKLHEQLMQDVKSISNDHTSPEISPRILNSTEELYYIDKDGKEKPYHDKLPLEDQDQFTVTSSKAVSPLSSPRLVTSHTSPIKEYNKQQEYESLLEEFSFLQATEKKARLSQDSYDESVRTTKEESNQYNQSLNRSRYNDESQNDNVLEKRRIYNDKTRSREIESREHFDNEKSEGRSSEVSEEGDQNNMILENIMMEMQKEAERLRLQVQESWNVERQRLIEMLAERESDLEHCLKELNAKNEELFLFKSELEKKDTLVRKQKEIKYRMQKDLEELEQRIKPITDEIKNVRGQEQKVNSIAISLGQHIESLQRTIAILKEERDEDINQEVQTQFKLIETLVKKENRLLRTFIDQMKKEMQNRKVILDEELLRLKKLVVEALDNELMPFGTSTNVVTDKIITHRDLENIQYAERVLQELEYEDTSYHVYVPSDPNDPIDFSVAQTLKAFNCPVHIEMERISQGEYIADRKIYLRMMNGQVVVKNGNMYETLTDYMTKLYAPFLDLDSASNVLDIALRNLNVSRDDILNDDTQLQKLLSTKEFVRQNSPHVPRPSTRSQSPIQSPRQSSTLIPGTDHRYSSPRHSHTPSTSTTNSTINSASSSTNSSRHTSPSMRRELLPPQKETRYTSILHAAASKNKLKSTRPPPPSKKLPVNSAVNDRRPSPPPNTISNMGINSNNNMAALNPQSNSRNSSPARRNTTPHRVTTLSSTKITNGNISTKKMRNRVLEGVDINDEKQIQELKRKALNQAIAQIGGNKK